MKNFELIRTYVGGKKSALFNEGNGWWLLSYTRGWGKPKEERPLSNMKGFFWAEPIFNAITLEAAIKVVTDLHGEVILEGSQEYAEIRANISRRTKKSKAIISEPVVVKPITEPEPAVVKTAINIKIDNNGKHEKFSRLCSAIRAGLDVYLYGPAGTGKSYMARQIAEELGLDFYPQSAINDKFELEGGQDPRNGSNGFIETAFYKAFKNGGLFLLDEADASDNTQLIALNNALADRRYNFPVVGLVEAHPDFRFIATGNTAGRGASASYNTRQAQDASFLNRFALRTKIDYDSNIELKCAENDGELVDFAHELRNALADIRCADAVFTYRNISMIKKLTSKNEFEEVICTIKEALEDNFFCALSPDTIKAINARISKGGSYKTALEEIAQAV